jgi:RNA polymerase sigma-70 factor (ECF subfamily)
MTGAEYRKLYSDLPDKACSTLFECYCDYVYAIVYNKLRSSASRADIEECVSDIFAEIFFSLKKDNSFDGELKGLVGTIAKRRAINCFYSITGRSRHISDDENALELMMSEENIESDSDDREIRKVLLNRIDELGEPDSHIIIQKFYYDRSSAEIADMLSMKASSVRMRAARALEKLRKILAEDGITL